MTRSASPAGSASTCAPPTCSSRPQGCRRLPAGGHASTGRGRRGRPGEGGHGVPGRGGCRGARVRVGRGGPPSRWRARCRSPTGGGAPDPGGAGRTSGDPHLLVEHRPPRRGGALRGRVTRLRRGAGRGGRGPGSFAAGPGAVDASDRHRHSQSHRPLRAARLRCWHTILTPCAPAISTSGGAQPPSSPCGPTRSPRPPRLRRPSPSGTIIASWGRGPRINSRGPSSTEDDWPRATSGTAGCGMGASRSTIPIWRGWPRSARRLHRTMYLGDPMTAAEWCRLALAQPGLEHLPRQRVSLLDQLAVARGLVGDIDAAQSLAEELGPDAVVHQDAGDLAGRVECTRPGRGRPRSDRDVAAGDHLDAVVSAYWLGHVLRRAGRPDEAVDTIARGLAIAVGGPQIPSELGLRAEAARLAAAGGRLDDAAVHLARGHEILASGERWAGLAGQVRARGRGGTVGGARRPKPGRGEQNHGDRHVPAVVPPVDGGRRRRLVAGGGRRRGVLRALESASGPSGALEARLWKPATVLRALKSASGPSESLEDALWTTRPPTVRW